MYTEASIKDLIQRHNTRAEDNRLIHIKSIDGSKLEVLKAKKRREKEKSKQGNYPPPLKILAKDTSTNNPFISDPSPSPPPIAFHTTQVLRKINDHHAALAQFSAELALSFLEGSRDELETMEIIVDGTDPDLPFGNYDDGDGTAPRVVYLPVCV